ncbi:MAG: hypothetical protein HOH33_08100 [Verrucomicrobia bacterium]|nr:hypothetical protein [Verrucomicrobiota bacterium]
MMRFTYFKALLLITTVLLQTGCLSTTVVNLTPSKLSRNAESMYRFEAAWESNQKSIQDDSIEGYVVMDEFQYPMKKVQVVKDRWEALIPLNPASEGYIYHLKFDFIYVSNPEPKPNSLRTKHFSLTIVEPNAR